MSRMSELSIEIQERLAEGQTPADVARALDIPTHWVTEIAEEDEYLAYMENSLRYETEANAYADADAIAYGNR